MEEIGRSLVLDFPGADTVSEKRASVRFVVAALALILILGAGARLFKLGSVPTGLNRDEVSTGYDAYSMLKTGRDQYGRFMPLFAQSHGDYNESIYRFLAIPTVAVFGLENWAVRLPAAVFGSATIIFFFLFWRCVFGDRIALLQSFLLAISPWHIHFSRVAFRAILFPFFLCLALYLFARGLEKPRWLVASAFAFVLATYTYSSARPFVPILVLGLVVAFWPRLREHARAPLVAFGSILVTGLAFLARFWLSDKGMARADMIVDIDVASWIASYFQCFSPSFLFFQSDASFLNETTGYALLYHLEFVFVLVALGCLVRGAVVGRHPVAFVILGLMLLYPIPGALTCAEFDRRAIIGSVIFPAVSGLGFWIAITAVKSLKLRRSAFAAVVLTLVALFLDYSGRYHTVYSDLSWYHWDHGWQYVIEYVEHSDSDLVFVSNDYQMAHVFVLFYTGYPPELYQESPAVVDSARLRVDHFEVGRYVIGDIENIEVDPAQSLTVVVRPEEIEELDARYGYEVVGAVESPIDFVPFVILQRTGAAGA